jgi:hypothetical protein
MSRNFTKHYEKYGEDDFTIYDGHSDDAEEYTHSEDAHFANGGDGSLDNSHVEAIINDAVDYALRDSQKQIQAIEHSNYLDIQMSEEEYQQFFQKQCEYHHVWMFHFVLKEFHHYVPPMLEARKMFQKEIGIQMSGKLIELEKKKLFYF